MANLAIKGHASRGNEVVEILEMLGGKNVADYNGTSIRSYYFLNNDIICSSYDSVKAPDFTNNDEERYSIYTLANRVKKDFCGVGDVNTILCFPTEEMRDAFHENFGHLIEICKELL